ncbi:MAG: hypothetical protein Tsb0027_10020 [Wenzhouxiangellaceae bacterium]
MNMVFKYNAIAIIILMCGASLAYSQDRFFGYFANNGAISQNQDHTNINFIWAGMDDNEEAIALLLSELSDAQFYNTRAIVPVDTFVFVKQGDSTTNTLAQCPFEFEQNSSLFFADLVDELVNMGFLVPNNPDQSTVAGFLVIDEPELCGLKDQNGLPHPALLNAVNTVRNNPQTSNFPIMTSVSKNYPQAINGIRLFDWVGHQWYSASTSSYLSSFDALSSSLNPNQRTILVPQASVDGFMSSAGDPHDPDLILNRFLADQRIVGIMPFLWDHAETTGTKDIPSLRQSYTSIGKHIKNGDPLPVIASLACSNQGGGLFECSVAADRGNPPYVYTWHGASAVMGNEASYFIACGVHGIQARVTITDSESEQITVSSGLFCDTGTVVKSKDDKGDG